ncbi:hypothetical protein GCM10025868_12870 [Angustibacter aerolatus]|uniref:Mannosyl-glycoprotein endo-beta-N-acetylglucosamidase-like domain-containing protein n=1 Tax=Angustibacter aerolatus TaxID=1162965 RepID=A0ABQ6JCX7_9ACTN|nr:hypothetical protein [Angustibacter aerolatus]GMA86037.1 hypothetical protein GCM10025868_12870 [Angustibacter aerolatus]
MTTYPYAARDAGGSVPPPPAATARSRRRRGPRVLLIGLLVAALVVAGVVLWQRRSTPFLGDECTATASGRGVDASPEQMGNAATIAGIALRRGLPARAATIAIATAIQESKAQNVDYGDRDSLGLFQQRPSQGWGTEAEVQDPVHATNAFYDALVKVRGYQGMEITKVAQKVQRSAYPEAYADHEPDARVLASALTGQSPAALSLPPRPRHRARRGRRRRAVPHRRPCRADEGRHDGRRPRRRPRARGRHHAPVGHRAVRRRAGRPARRRAGVRRRQGVEPHGGRRRLGARTEGDAEAAGRLGDGDVQRRAPARRLTRRSRTHVRRPGRSRAVQSDLDGDERPERRRVVRGGSGLDGDVLVRHAVRHDQALDVARAVLAEVRQALQARAR